MNAWHELPTGPKVPDIINAIIEIPKGSRNKYEYDKESGMMRLDRVLYSSLHYPGDYGLIPRTFCEDGDPLDILVMTNSPTFPGCLVQAEPIGLFRMLDKGEADDKILAVLTNEPFFRDYHDLSDLPAHYLDEVTHFFSVYKDLEGARVEPVGWEGAAVARRRVTEAIDMYEREIAPKILAGQPLK